MHSTLIRTSKMDVVLFIAGLVSTILLSVIVISYLLKKDEDYGEFKIFPIDYVSIISFVFLIFFYVITYTELEPNLLITVIIVLYISMLFICAYIDIRTHFIYDIVLVVFGTVLFILACFVPSFEIIEAIKSMLIGGGFYTLIYIISKLVYKREAFGKGDILLMTVGAILLRPIMTLIACFMAFYIAALFILLMYLFGKKIEKISEVSFGQYICLSLIIMLAYGLEIVNFIEGLL